MGKRTFGLLVVLLVAIGVAPALAGVPFIVDEDFEDGTADGFVAGVPSCFFGNDAQLGTVEDDGTGTNMVYSISEHVPNEVRIVDAAIDDFDLRFDYIGVGVPGAGIGAPAVFFRADPGSQTGYMTDGGGIGLITGVIEEGELVCGFIDLAGAEPSDFAGRHTMRVVAKDDKIRVFRDGGLVASVRDSTYGSGYISIADQNGGIILIDNVRLKVKIGNGH